MGKGSRSVFLELLLFAVLGSGCGVVAPSATAPQPSVSPTGAPVPSASPTTPAPTVQPTSVPTSPPASTATPSRTATPTSTAPTTAAPGCGLPRKLLGQDLTTIPGAAAVVALTFDAGGSDAGLASILKTLGEHAAPATFFLTGRFTRDFPAASVRIAKDYPVGNHTDNHRDLTKLPARTARAEIRTGEASIRTATGVNPRPYFRFPLGARNAETIALVNAECYVPFRWTVDTLGWQGTEGRMSADKVYQRVLDGLRPGAIILMHVGANPDDGTTFDADALPRMIEGIRDRGYTLVTLERALPATP